MWSVHHLPTNAKAAISLGEIASRSHWLWWIYRHLHLQCKHCAWSSQFNALTCTSHRIFRILHPKIQPAWHIPIGLLHPAELRIESAWPSMTIWKLLQDGTRSKSTLKKNRELNERWDWLSALRRRHWGPMEFREEDAMKSMVTCQNAG